MRIMFFATIVAMLLATTAMANAQNWNDDAGSERLSRLEDQVQALSQRAGGGNGGGAGMNGAAAAQFDARIAQLEQQIRALTGQVEKTHFDNMQLQNRLERMAQDLEVRFNEVRTQQQLMATAQATAAQPVPPAPTVIEGAADAAADNAAPPAAGGENAQALYDDGFAKLRAADYANAEQSFKKFLGGHPQHALAGNAAYWLGETYYVRGQFKEAAVTFADAYQKYPKNSKAPDNLLKLAMALSSLGSKEDACLTLGELKTKYPNAAPTIRTRADAERKKLACK
jgi:tol-pal system protein YbgF